MAYEKNIENNTLSNLTNDSIPKYNGRNYHDVMHGVGHAIEKLLARFIEQRHPDTCLEPISLPEYIDQQIKLQISKI